MIKENIQSVHLVYPCRWYATCSSCNFHTVTTQESSRQSLCSKLIPVCLFFLKHQTSEVTEYTYAKWPTYICCLAELMAVNMTHVIGTKNIFQIFLTEKLFPPLINGLEKIIQLMCKWTWVYTNIIQHLSSTNSDTSTRTGHMREIHRTQCCRSPPYSFSTPTNSNDCKDFSQLITYHKEHFTSGFFENVLVILHLCVSFYLLMRHTFQDKE